MKVKTSKGFTLAELLIVMAIIVVLAAVAIPTFGKQLETSRETGDMEIIRNAYTEALTIATLDGSDGVLNGVIGDPNPTDTPAVDGTVKWGAVAWVGNSKYKVTLSHASAPSMNAKFSQSATSDDWTYVNGTLMGEDVPEVNVGLTTLTFEFSLDVSTGDISLEGIEAAAT